MERIAGTLSWPLGVYFRGGGIGDPMGRWRGVSSVVFLILISGGRVLSGEYPGPGERVDKPEAITGIWEMPVADGAVGLTIRLDVTIEGEPRQFAEVDQRVQDYEIGIYHRTGEELKLNNLSLFEDDSNGVKLKDNRLRIRVSYRKPAVSADVTFDLKKEVWTGFLDIEGFRGSVTLRRPIGVSTALSPSLAGTWWAAKGASGGSCLHIGKAAGGRMTAWLDRFVFPGLFRFPPGAPHWKSTPWSYGALVIAKPAGPIGLSLVFDPFTAFCCSSTFEGRLSADGESLTGFLLLGQGSGGPEVWSRVRGSSCRIEPQSGKGE